MQFVTGALDTVLPKLANLLHGEYNLQNSVRKNIQFIIKELETMQGALCSVSAVPPEQLPELVRIWARDARELSYDMEDIVDTFLVRIEGPGPPTRRNSRAFFQNMKSLLTMGRCHQIGKQIKEIKKDVVELATRRDRYKDYTINPVATTLDPRIAHLYTKATDLIGIKKVREELILKLQQQRIVSIVGFGGLGKTTLAKAVYDEMKYQFHCTAFISVSQNPDMKKFLKDMIYDLNPWDFRDIHNRSLDEKQLIDIARGFLHNRRYLIIIDDIWNISHWDMVIKHALPDNDTEYKVITTTRNITIANRIGVAYQIQPLSIDNSRVLLHTRILGTEDQEQSLDVELAEVSNRILKKCAGVPLAIITIASLLASKGRNKTKWADVCNSIGNGMEDSVDVENMRKILAYSYYDLPSYLRTCLLYLSMFPEDFEIEKDRLIWLWIAEGFIKQDKQRRKRLFEVGESYFNELINRSMIQPLNVNDYSLKIMGCRVHDMVLDLLCSISSEENFVTILSSMGETYPSTKVRRLSLQNGKTDNAMAQATRSMRSVRSVVIFPSALDQMPTAFESFEVLRVLDLHHCNLSQGYNLQYLGNLFHLRYLNLLGTRISQLPEAVANLKFLEVLDLRINNIYQLPKSIAQLTHLLCLLVDANTRICSGIGSLTSLEELTWLRICDDSTDTVEGLGLLTELRVLRISLHTNKYNDKLVESLCKLQKIHTISFDGQLNMSVLDACVFPQLRVWITTVDSDCWFSTLPAWMNNSLRFGDLYYLCIAVRELQQQDLEILGRLPALRDLYLEVDHVAHGIVGSRFNVGAGWFPCLAQCVLRFLGLVVFQEGAMPRLGELEFWFHVSEARKIANSDGGLDCGLGNLMSLRKVIIWFQLVGTSEEEVPEAEDALRRAAEIHPNRPYLKIYACMKDDELWV